MYKSDYLRKPLNIGLHKLNIRDTRSDDIDLFFSFLLIYTSVQCKDEIKTQLPSE